MKKLLISILIALIAILCILSATNGIKIGGINILGISEIKNKSNILDKTIQNATKIASTDFPKATADIETDVKKLQEEKKNYEDMVTVSTDEQVQTATQFQKYEIEYLWTVVGNHATSEGVVIKMDLVKGTGENNYNLNFTANGSYIGIVDFISDIENDAVLGFKIEEFKMLPNNDTSDLQATFTCKDITIKDISETPINTDNNQQENGNTTNDTTNQNNTNTNSTNKNNTTSNTNKTNTNSNSTKTNTNANNTNTAK